MDSIVDCRYNKNHRIRQSRLLIHEQKCPDKKCSKMVNCPYNPRHKVSFLKFENHKKTCPDKPHLDELLQNEMQAYIQQMKKQSDEKKTQNSLPSQMKSTISNQLSTQAKIQKNIIIEEKKIEVPQKETIREEDIFNLRHENGVVEYNAQDDDYNIDYDSEDKDNGVFDNVYQ